MMILCIKNDEFCALKTANFVVIQFAGTTQKGVDPNGFFETPSELQR